MAILNTNSTQDASLVTGESFDFLTQAVKTKFLNSFETDLDSIPLYIFYGKSTRWDSPNAPTDSPTQPSNSFSDDISIRQNMLALKKVLKQDTRVAFVQHTWSSGKVFDQYDVNKDHSLAANREIYSFQDSNILANYGAVYKCLDNNNGSGSTERPYFNPQTAPVTLDDGYKWKYMFTIPAAELSKFQTNQAPNDNFLPIVEDTTYKGDAGTIDRIDITTGGTGYTPYNTIPLVDNNTPIGIYVKGDGLEIDTSRIKILSVTTNNAIDTFSTEQENLVQGGGYSRNATYGNWVPVRFEDFGLSDSEISALIDPNRKEAYGLAKINAQGTIDSPRDVIVIDGGSGYTADSEVKIVQSSTIAYGTVTDGVISSIKITNAGKNHRSATVIPVHAHSSGTDFKGVAQISPINGHGSDAKKELNANAIFINNRVTATPNTAELAAGLQTLDFSRTNDFRQVGLIQGPRGISTVEDSPAPFINDETANAKYSLTVNEIDTSVADNVVADTLIIGNQSGATGRVVDVFTSGGNKVIRYNKTGVSDFRVSENILATGLSGNHRISSVTNPEVDVFTGDILFINNSEPISRDEDQSETVNFIITF
tara:strand:- start:3467 stop:5254 length:1788 start_codon:yes stop_codon:yes gene_type:complete